MRRPRVLLADEHALLREAFARLLGPDREVVSAVGAGRALLEVTQKLRPDVIVRDLAMPLRNGFEPVWRTGATAYVVKSQVASDLVPAPTEALAGRSFISSMILSS